MEYYRKVFIKSKEDLPKEMITVFTFSDEAGEGFDIKVNPLDQGCLDNLLMFDWYLLPAELPTDEEIRADLAIEIIARFSTKTSRGTAIAKNSFIDGAKWMRDKFKDK